MKKGIITALVLVFVLSGAVLYYFTQVNGGKVEGQTEGIDTVEVAQADTLMVDSL